MIINAIKLVQFKFLLLKTHNLKVLFEDNHLLIVNKPAGILSQGDKTRDTDIIAIAKNYIKIKYEKPGDVFLGLAHRLDRPVSGALILCRTSKSLTRMTELFKKRQIKKVYHALIIGRPSQHSEKLISYIKKDSKRNRAIISKKPFVGAKKAILTYSQIAELNKHSLLEVELETGRPHQIRAQLSAAKLPILGDLKYHPQNPLEDKSIALHCYSMEFIHPVKKEVTRVTAAYPNKSWWKNFT